MKIQLRKLAQAGNNVIAQLFLDGRIVSPQGMHMSPGEFANLAIILSLGVSADGAAKPTGTGHTFEVDDT